ncbi:MAG: YjbQ family protein [Candidatus Aenigmatarchaeota archaeon]|nr:MAG: YjbQ family protein [Candidatus Aenigmarchaeota archaeon]
MQVITEYIKLSTSPDELYDITGQITEFIRKNSLKNGQITVFAVGSTCGITTIEYEPGLRRDFPEMLSRIAPRGHYHHDATWGDGNGHSHLRSSLIGTSFVVPVVEGNPVLGTWQQIVFCEFDIRPRQRKVVLQFIGETA